MQCLFAVINQAKRYSFAEASSCLKKGRVFQKQRRFYVKGIVIVNLFLKSIKLQGNLSL